MSRLAQSRAEYLSTQITLESSPQVLDGVVLGQNILMLEIPLGPVKIDPTAAAKNAVKTWYRRITSYNFKRPAYQCEAGSFTQLIWKDSRKLGVGIALSPDKRTICLVANYYPQGNVTCPGSFEKNVLPAKF